MKKKFLRSFFCVEILISHFFFEAYIEIDKNDPVLKQVWNWFENSFQSS